MNQKEAIEQLENLLGHCESMANRDSHVWDADCQALKIAIVALRPVGWEQVEELWSGEWQDMSQAYNDVPKRRCSRCQSVFIGLDTPFCEACGAPMTDEAVQMVMERLEALHGKTD